MTPEQIDRLAAAANAMRPDWPTKSVRTFIERNLAHRAYRDACVALVWVATTDTETPRLVLEAGPWWRAAVTDDAGNPTRYPPKRHQECRQHPGEWADACRPCITDAQAADARDHDQPIPGADAETARAALRKDRQ